MVHALRSQDFTSPTAVALQTWSIVSVACASRRRPEGRIVSQFEPPEAAVLWRWPSEVSGAWRLHKKRLRPLSRQRPPKMTESLQSLSPSGLPPGGTVVGGSKAKIASATGQSCSPLWSRFNCATATSSQVKPNPSLKLSTNSVAHWPSSAGPAAHFALAVQRVTPLVPA